MESRRRWTFFSVFVIFYVNKVYVYSQSLPPGQTIKINAEYGDFGYPNADGQPPGRGFPGAIVQSRETTDAIATGTYAQRSSMPSTSQLLYSLPSPNLIGPIGPILIPPPLSSIAPVLQYVPNAHTVPSGTNNLPPPPTIGPTTYVGTNPQTIPSVSNAPVCHNSEIQPTIHIIANPTNLPSQGSPITAQFIPSRGSIAPCPQELPSPKLFIPGLPHSNIITYNHQSPIPNSGVPISQVFQRPPQNVYNQNINDRGSIPCNPISPQATPSQGLGVQFIPNSGLSAPFTQIEILPPAVPIPPQNSYVQNINDRGSIARNSISPQSVPSQSVGVQFIPNPGLSAPFTQIEILPPAIPPYRDPKFASQQFYADQNSVPPFMPPQSYPLITQFLPDTCNSIPPPIALPPLTTCSSVSFPQESANPTIFPNQEVFLPSNYYQPSTTNFVQPPQIPINFLPMVLPPEPILPISGEENSLPINLQINFPAANVPPPSITIISTVPPNPLPTNMEASDSDSVPYPLGNFIPFPTYPPPPIIVKGSKSKCKKWIPMLIALFANRGCCDGCDGGCCCTCGNNIPIPFPIAIPTNNPILMNSKKSCSKCNSEYSNDETTEERL